MQPETKLRRVKAFASDAGVSVRTLHLYDQLGLLKPAAVTESGYRLYGETELERLEHILALRFIGFNLDQIKELLANSERPLLVALRMQRQVIAREKRRLDAALDALDEAERALADDRTADRWQTLRNVIEVFKMQNDWDWTRNYYSDEAGQRIEERQRNTPKSVVDQGQRDWTALLSEVEEAASQGMDPHSAPAQTLADRWRGLLAQFTGGNAEIQRGLNRLWSDSTHWPKDFKRPWSDAADAFIKKALNSDS
jgi:DNA-binding transcriptional MerR regulator